MSQPTLSEPVSSYSNQYLQWIIDPAGAYGNADIVIAQKELTRRLLTNEEIS